MRAIIAMRMLPLLTMPSLVSVKKSGAIAILSVPQELVNEPHNPAQIFATGGRAIQRLWLAGTAAGLSMHPLGSVSIFLLTEDPKPDFRTTIDRVRVATHELIPQLAGRTVQLALRVGRGAAPSIRSIRRPLEALTLNDSV